MTLSVLEGHSNIASRFCDCGALHGPSYTCRDSYW